MDRRAPSYATSQEELAGLDAELQASLAGAEE
jgi:hypothetical protein